MFWLFDLQRKIVGCVCCIVCLGPFLLTFGLIYLVSTDFAAREHQIQAYNDAVDAWTNKHREAFENFTGSLVVDKEVTLSKDEEDTDKLAENSKDWKTYKQLRFVAPGKSLVLDRPWIPNVGAPVTLKIQRGSGSYENVIKLMKLTEYTSIDLNCDRDNGKECVNACSRKKGTWDSYYSRCEVFEALDDFCLKVKSDDNDKWSPSGSNGGYGCGYSGDSKLLQTFKTLDNPEVVSFDGTFYIRSQYDPYVIAAQLTKGTYKFDLSVGEKVVVGSTFIAVGGFFIFLSCLVVFCVYKKCHKGSNHRYHNIQSNYNAPPTTYQQPIYQQQPNYAPPTNYQQPPNHGASAPGNW